MDGISIPNIPTREVVKALRTFHLKKGEILAFCGPMGAGSDRADDESFSAEPTVRPAKEVLKINGKEMHFHTPKDAIENGMGYVSEDSKGSWSYPDSGC